MTTVILKLKSGLEKHYDKNIIELELKCKSSIASVLKEINFPEEKAGVVLVDGRISNKNHVLCGGETVKLFPKTLGC